MVTGLKNMGSKQKAAWESILAYVKEHGGSTTVTFTLGDVVGSKETLDKLVSRKVLNVKKSYNNGFYYRDYSVNPYYLPASEPAAEPVADAVLPADYFTPVDPIAASEPVAGQFTKGQRVYLPSNSLFKDTTSPRYGTVTGVKNLINSYNGDNFQQVWVQFDDPNLGKREVHPSFLIIASEPATDDRPTSDEARLIDSITEARIDRQRLENENASLTSQLEALRVRFAEMEAENASLQRQNGDVLSVVKELEAENAKLLEQVEKLNDEAENMSAHIVQVEKARDFWRGKKEDIEVALGVQRAACEQWETRAKAAEAIIKTFHS